MSAFRSYDIRGIYGSDIDDDFAENLGVALGRHFAAFPEHKDKRKLHIIVGRDMRDSAARVAPRLIEGFRKVGHDVTDIGMVSTPCSYFAVQELGADGGVMCTASHNPAEYIGFKVCREQAIPIGYDTGLAEVEKTMGSKSSRSDLGSLRTANLNDQYLDFLASLADTINPTRVTVDASNGMAGPYLQPLFDKLGCELDGMFLDPNGSFPNHEADPSKIENLEMVGERVRSTGAIAGFSLDGDGDRLGVVDERGEAISGDLVAALLSQDSLEIHPGGSIAYDLRSTKALQDVIEDAGGTAIRSRVGHAHVKKLMRERGVVFASELSGHFYFKLPGRQDYYADSGLTALVRMLNIVGRLQKPLSEVVSEVRKYSHTGEINYKILQQQEALQEIRETFSDADQDELDGVSVRFRDWWFNVRSSNTEPLLRLTLEGDSAQLRDDGLSQISAILEKYGERH